MSATGLEVFDKTLQTTNIWLNEVMEGIGPDRNTAWRVLAVVLHRLRNRLPIGLAANLGAQLPMLVRGLYYDQFQPEQLPSECDTFDQFCAEVAEWLRDNRPVDPETAVKSVFRVLDNHVSPGEIANVVQALPESIRQAWPVPARERAESQIDQSGNAQQQRDDGSPPTRSRGNESVTGRQPTGQEERELEPASPSAQQRMTGGTDGSGPAR